jgi:hypothetical protein
MFLKLIIFVILLYLIIVLYGRYKHPYWFYHPVDFFYTLSNEEGVIGQPYYIHNYNRDYRCSRWSNSEEIIEFLNENFQPGGGEYLYKNTKKDTIFYKIMNKKDNYVSGCISARKVNVILDNKEYIIWYVDHLALKISERNNRIATDLISYMIKDTGAYVIIFKKDNQPLPFKYFCKYNYYKVLDKSQPEQPNVVDDISLKKKYSMYIEPDKGECIFLEKNGCYAIVYYSGILDSNKKEIYEIAYAENKEMAQLSVNYLEDKTSRILVNELSGTNLFYKTEYLSTNYLYFYNYRKHIMNPKDIFICIQ